MQVLIKCSQSNEMKLTFIHKQIILVLEIQIWSQPLLLGQLKPLEAHAVLPWRGYNNLVKSHISGMQRNKVMD